MYEQDLRRQPSQTMEYTIVTTKGFLGRTFTGEAKAGDVDAFLHGRWSPYILEKRRYPYQLRSFISVQGSSRLEIVVQGSK